VTALTDIHIAASSGIGSSSDGESSEDLARATFVITPQILSKLLIALNECTEWGRVAILSSLARYTARDEKESEHICERVVPQFQHANGSVVLAAVKVKVYSPLPYPMT
jgi:AP-1 complex subunit beta-1